MQILHLRDATQDDLDLTYAIAEDAMRKYIEEIWGDWNSDEQRRKHLASFTPETHKIILIDDTVAGFVAVETFPTYIWLAKLYLFDEHRGHGIGSKVLVEILEGAGALGKKVTLQVLRINTRAQALYTRHGFKVTEQRNESLFMTCEA